MIQKSPAKAEGNAR